MVLSADDRVGGYSLEVGDDLDFHARGLGQAGDLDGGAGGEILGEIFRVDLVHAREICQVREEHGGFHDIGERKSLVIQDGLHVLEDAVGLDLDVAGDEIAVFRVNRDLAGTEQEVTHAYGVIVRADGCG